MDFDVAHTLYLKLKALTECKGSYTITKYVIIIQ